MFSEELRILDHNTAEYMVDVMQDEIDALKLRNVGQQETIAGQQETIEGQQETIDSLQEEIAYLKAQLDALKQ